MITSWYFCDLVKRFYTSSTYSFILHKIIHSQKSFLLMMNMFLLLLDVSFTYLFFDLYEKWVNKVISIRILITNSMFFVITYMLYLVMNIDIGGHKGRVP